MGAAHYDHGSGACEATHHVVLGVTFAFGEEPLRHIPTPEEAGVERAWLGMVDPVLDCNGWMLDDATLLPKFKFGDPDPQDPTLIRRGSEVFHVGEHFDIDRSGRVYRPHQYVALAGEHEFTEAKTAEKLALPVCEFGPRIASSSAANSWLTALITSPKRSRASMRGTAPRRRKSAS